MQREKDLPNRIVTYLDILYIMILFILGVTSCQGPVIAQATKKDTLQVVATTSLVGDVVSQVGGDKVSVEVLLPLGTDPHSFSPTPRDASAISDASLVFANGVGLEEFLKPLLDSVGGAEKVVEVSQGVPLRSIIEQESGNKPVDDPHTWMDPNNVMIWVDNITKALSEKDPQNADYYQANGQAYKGRLVELDNQIRSEVAAVPEQNRKIVTEHMVFGYFAEQYGFSQVGAIIPGFSSLAEPSAQDIAHIEDSIKTLGVKAIFLSIGVNENIARRIAEDTGTRLALLYMESLSDKKGPAGNYLDFMQFDVLSMVDALK